VAATRVADQSASAARGITTSDWRRHAGVLQRPFGKRSNRRSRWLYQSAALGGAQQGIGLSSWQLIAGWLATVTADCLGSWSPPGSDREPGGPEAGYDMAACATPDRSPNSQTGQSCMAHRGRRRAAVVKRIGPSSKSLEAGSLQ